MRLGTVIGDFVEAAGIGETFAAGTGFLLERNPDTVYAPDVSFVRAELRKGHDEDEWYPHAPDLAVEVLSPSELEHPSGAREKGNAWLRVGARSVWAVDPRERTVTIHRADGSMQVIREDEMLRDDSVLPGFILKPLGKIFR